jgi:hypothetical protein
LRLLSHSLKVGLSKVFLIPWATWIVILTSARAYQIMSFHKQENIESKDNWLKIYTITTFLSGIFWGILLLQVLNPISGNESFTFIVYFDGNDSWGIADRHGERSDVD